MTIILIIALILLSSIWGRFARRHGWTYSSGGWGGFSGGGAMGGGGSFGGGGASSSW